MLKIAAHRIGTAEVESALLTHPGLAEAGVTGRPDELRGEVIAASVVLRASFRAHEGLPGELEAVLRGQLGPLAVLGEVWVVSSLPKTRSGKPGSTVDLGRVVR